MTDMDNLEFLESPHSTPTQAEEDYQWNRSDIAVAEATKKDCVIVRPRSSEKPHRYHAVVTLKKETVDAKTRILYQAVLGSDPVREVLSLLRLERDDPMPTIFFERASGRKCTCGQSVANVVGDHHTLSCSMYEERDGLP